MATRHADRAVPKPRAAVGARSRRTRLEFSGSGLMGDDGAFDLAAAVKSLAAAGYQQDVTVKSL
jgi:hypothetical protein